MPITSQADYDQLDGCGDKKEILKICAAEIASLRVKCADHLEPGPTDPTAVCLSASSETEKQFFTRHIALWCLPKPDAGLDAGDDAGEAGDDAGM